MKRDDVARAFKVGVNAVQQAKAVLAEAPDLAAQVEACTLSLAAAYEETQQRIKQVKQKQRDAERIAEYKDAISNGEMKLEEALEKAMREEREEREKLEVQADAAAVSLRGLGVPRVTNRRD